MMKNSVWNRTRRLPGTDAVGVSTGYQNMMQLIQLRWIAVCGQLLTIVFAWQVFEMDLPLAPMFCVIASLVLLNLFSLLRPRRDRAVYNRDLLAGLVVDVVALTTLLYLSGGATNPFVFLYPLQVTLGAMLLNPRSTWALVGLVTACFAVLMQWYVPLPLKPHQGVDYLFKLHIWGMLICLVLDVALIVVFMTRIHRNLSRRDATLADLRQRAAEEDHIVRMGLLASGAAHELGTPLATLSVILGDWKRMPTFAQDPDLLQEISDMQAEVARCKSILSGILLSAGEARGESPTLTTVSAFLDELVREWRASRPVQELVYRLDKLRSDAGCEAAPIVADPALKQVICNVLDNALDASPAWLSFTATCREGELRLAVRDRGPGFLPEMLEHLGKPYSSSKGRPGGGLGLFLVVNVLRKLGGSVEAQNHPGGGAEVTLQLPLAALSLPAAADD